MWVSSGPEDTRSRVREGRVSKTRAEAWRAMFALAGGSGPGGTVEAMFQVGGGSETHWRES
eukprot:1288446-Rhodomonas_salina.2